MQYSFLADLHKKCAFFFALICSSFLLICSFTTPAHAQSHEQTILYLTEPDKSQTSLLFELIPEFLDETVPKGLLIEHIPGLGGAKAWHSLQKEQPDGSHLAAITFPAFILKPLVGEGHFSPEKLTPVCIIAKAPFGLWVPEKSRFTNLVELIMHLRTKTTGNYIGGIGSYTTAHVGTFQFARAAGVTVEYLPYLGSGEVAFATFDGQAQACWGIVAPASTMPQMRLLAVADSKRSILYPDIPTFSEHGVIMELAESYGLALPADPHIETVEATSELFTQLTINSDFQIKAEMLGFTITPIPFTEIETFLATQKEAMLDFIQAFPITQ